jgi:hypothetical protein
VHKNTIVLIVLLMDVDMNVAFVMSYTGLRKNDIVFATKEDLAV